MPASGLSALSTALRAPRSTLCLSLLLLFAGCEPEPAADPTAADPKFRPAVALRLLIVDDPEIAAAVGRRSGEWHARTGGTLTVAETTSAELLKRKILDADAVIYPSRYLGHLAERKLIVPVRTALLERDEYDLAGVFELVRDRETVWGQSRMALPLGSPVPLLMYRTDLFQALARHPPNTWVEYADLAALLGDRKSLGDVAPLKSEPWYGTVEPTKGDAAAILHLARAAAYARHPDHYSTLFQLETMEPLIAGPPFVRALEELVQASRASGAPPLSPRGTADVVFRGQAAMAITWIVDGTSVPMATRSVSDESGQELGASIGFAELPGSLEVFDVSDGAWEAHLDRSARRVTLLGAAGRLASVTSKTKNVPAAQRLLAWITGSEMGSRIGSVSHFTAPFRASQLAQQERWLGQQPSGAAIRDYGATLHEALKRSRALHVPRIPAADEYLESLSAAVRAAIAGETSSANALKEAAARWKETTERHGNSAQRSAFAHSVGLEP